jgi:hypothetical protein
VPACPAATTGAVALVTARMAQAKSTTGQLCRIEHKAALTCDFMNLAVFIFALIFAFIFGLMFALNSP